MIIQLTFPVLNVSLQIGDLIYFARNNNQVSGFNNWSQPNVDTKPKLLGVVVGIAGTTVSVDNMLGGGTGLVPTGQDVIMFQKDKRAGVSGITGYYALTEYRNWSPKSAEMFATAVDYVESSK